MKKITVYIFVLIGNFGFVSCNNNLNDSNLSLAPWPQNIEISSETNIIGTDLLFVNHSNNNDVERIISTCINDFEEIGFSVNAHMDRNYNLNSITRVNLYLKKDESGNHCMPF